MDDAKARLAGVRHWVFDLDGTLTVAVHDFDAIRRELGIPQGEPILEHIAREPAERREQMLRELHRIEHALCERAKAAEGAEELLRSLHERSARLAIFTRNARDLALYTLEVAGLGAFFCEDDVIGRDEAPPKPRPEGLMRIAARWGVQTSECAMVGDFRYDLLSGRAVSALTVHVDPSGTFAWPELADIAVRSLRELVS